MRLRIKMNFLAENQGKLYPVNICGRLNYAYITNQGTPTNLHLLGQTW